VSLRRHGLGIGEPVRAQSPTTLFQTRSLRFDSTSAKEKEDSRSFDASGSCRSLDIDYLGAFELGANDRSAGLFDCPSKLETAASKGSGLRGGPVRQSCPLYAQNADILPSCFFNAEEIPIEAKKRGIALLGCRKIGKPSV
jgi:hypothetical protein